MEQPGYIYAIEAENGFVKIGYTTNLSGRLSHLRANNCMALTGLGYVAASKHHETELHELLASERERNEWFRRGRLVEHFISQIAPWPEPRRHHYRRRRRKSSPDRSELLEAIEAYLRASEMPPSEFGKVSVNDPSFVGDLRRGREPRGKTQQRVVEWMNNHPVDGVAA